MPGTAQERPPRRHRLTVDDYYRMGEAGILRPDERVELIEGEILDIAPPGARPRANRESTGASAARRDR